MILIVTHNKRLELCRPCSYHRWIVSSLDLLVVGSSRRWIFSSLDRLIVGFIFSFFVILFLIFVTFLFFNFFISFSIDCLIPFYFYRFYWSSLMCFDVLIPQWCSLTVLTLVFFDVLWLFWCSLILLTVPAPVWSSLDEKDESLSCTVSPVFLPAFFPLLFIFFYFFLGYPAHTNPINYLPPAAWRPQKKIFF